MNITPVLKKHWFFIGIALVVYIAFAVPGVGMFIQSLNIVDMAIVLAFFLTGLTLETGAIVRQAREGRVLVIALGSTLILFPLVTWPVAALFFGPDSDAAVGVLIIAAAPVTIASGMVMTSMALGNVSLSLLICVACNALAVVTVPFMLDLTLGSGVETITLPVLTMLGALALKVLLPTVLGQLLRPLVKEWINHRGPAFSVFNQCIVLLIMLNGISSSSDQILGGGSVIAGIFVFMLAAHAGFLLFNYGLSRLLKLDRPSTAAFTIQTSQKTLTVSYLVWAGYFAESFPMALIPAIAYHFIQLIVDTFVADHFRRSSSLSDQGTEERAPSVSE